MTNANEAGDAEVLVTGATGLIGRWLLAALTQRGQRVVALVRGANERADELRAFVERIGGDGRHLVIVEGDVEKPDLGLTRPFPRVRVVHHLAARFAFGMTRDDARRANVDGTRNVVLWASRQPAMDRVVLLGGYRMTKVDLGRLDARTLETHYAHGAYEGSKIEAYALFVKLASEHSLRWTAVHPSGVIGDSRTGETTQLVGLGDTVKALFERRLPALAGSERTFVPIVTVDFLARYLATVPERAESAGRDLVVFDPATPTLPELVRRLARALGVAAPTTTLPVGFVAALPSAWTGLHRESTHFLSEDTYDTRAGEAHAAAMGLTHPPLDAALAHWCAFLVSTRFLAAPRAMVGHFSAGTFVVGDPSTSEAVLLHGIPFDGEAMAPLARAMGGTTARIDLPGLGRSAPGAIDADALHRVLGVRTRPVTLVGHSLGAGLAVRYAAAHPEMVSALVLVAPAFMAAPAPWLLHVSPLVGRVLAGLDAADFERRFLVERAPGPVLEATESALASLGRGGVARAYANALAEAASAASRRATLADYEKVRARGIPVLVVHARKEPLLHDTRGAAVVTIDEAGHNPHLTHTAVVARAIRAFRAPSLELSATA